MSKQYGFMIWKMNVVYEFVNALKSIVLAKPIINIEIHGYGIQDLGTSIYIYCTKTAQIMSSLSEQDSNMKDR